VKGDLIGPGVALELGVKFLILVCAAAALAGAQGIDLGVMAGGGGITASGPTMGAGHIGAEACAFCEGRYGVFAEYSHWMTSGSNAGSNPSDLVRRADLAGAGLRIQGLGRARPFFDVGVVGGRDTHGSGTGGAVGGVVLGGGWRAPFHERWYIRPQLRVYGLSPHTLEGVDAHWGMAALVGVGYSWK
jgi:hypothetical protein